MSGATNCDASDLLEENKKKNSVSVRVLVLLVYSCKPAGLVENFSGANHPGQRTPTEHKQVLVLVSLHGLNVWVDNPRETRNEQDQFGNMGARGNNDEG